MKKSVVKPGVAPAPPGEGEFSLIPNDKLLDLYAAMLKCRMIARIVPIGKQNRRPGSKVHSEAVTAGVTIDLLAGDAISPAASDLTPCLVKNSALESIPLKSLLHWWSNPSARMPGVVVRANVIPPAASTAARIEAALRLAAYFRSTNSGSVVVLFMGPDSPQPKRYAAANLPQLQLQSFMSRVALARLPILFVMQSESDSDDFMPLSQLSGVPGMVVDCHDVVAVYRAASEALTHARRGNGPSLIHSKPWRLAGDLPKKRETGDSIAKMELYLTGKGLAYRSVKDRIIEKFNAELGRTGIKADRLKKS